MVPRRGGRHLDWRGEWGGYRFRPYGLFALGALAAAADAGCAEGEFEPAQEL